MSELRPMLAVEAPEQIMFPVWASPKLDGIRCLIVDGQPVSRTLKVIPNLYVQNYLSSDYFNGLDGELIVGDATHPNAMQNATSGIMSVHGEPDFTFYIFDYWTDPKIPYDKRYENLKLAFQTSMLHYPRLKLLEQKLIYTNEDLLMYESDCVEKGYEGVITRRLGSPYKYNRSTTKEQYLLKIKRFVDGEARIIGFNEFQHNDNEATIDERGYTKRSSHQENKIAGDMLGSFIVKDLKTSIEFNVGTGFTMEQRKQFWAEKELYIGRIVKYKSMQTGVKVAPRHPTFLGFRHEDDI